MLELLAAEGGSPVDPKLVPAITSIVVFIVFFFILRATVWPKIIKGLDDREHKIRSEIEAAEHAREKAKAAQEEYEQSLTTARKDAAAMIAKAKTDAGVAADELRRRNETEMAELKQRAGRDIEAAKHAAINELHAEAATLASAIAAKILRREISVDDQQALVEESLRELGRASEN